MQHCPSILRQLPAQTSPASLTRSAALLNPSGTYCCTQQSRAGIVWARLIRAHFQECELHLHPSSCILGSDWRFRRRRATQPQHFPSCLPTRRNTLLTYLVQTNLSIGAIYHLFLSLSTPAEFSVVSTFLQHPSSFAGEPATFLLHKRTYHDRQSCPAHKYCVAHVPHQQVTRQSYYTIFNINIVDLVS